MMVAICISAIMFRMRNVVPYLRCGLRNQSSRTPSSATRFSTPLTPISEVFTAPARISTPTITTNTWKPSFSSWRSGEIHHQAADHVVVIAGARGIGDDHHRQDGDQPGADDGIGADDVCR